MHVILYFVAFFQSFQGFKMVIMLISYAQLYLKIIINQEVEAR